MLVKITSIFHNNRGASLPEYALLCSIIALVSVASVGYYGDKANQSFSRSGTAMGGYHTVSLDQEVHIGHSDVTVIEPIVIEDDDNTSESP